MRPIGRMGERDKDIDALKLSPIPIRLIGFIPAPYRWTFRWGRAKENYVDMFSRAGRVLSVVALAYLVGGHWAILQGIAWAGMVSQYSQHQDLGTALVQTFDGKHPCPLCLAIAKKRQTEDRRVVQSVVGKLLAVLLESAWTALQPGKSFVYFEVDYRPEGRRTAPPIPPPRGGWFA